MKKITLVAIILFVLGSFSFIYAETNKEAVERVSLNYIEGFYEGDTEKLSSCLDPKLHKFGFWKNKDSQKYKSAGFMSYKQAIAYAENVKKTKKFAKSNAPKKVEVIEVLEKIAITKVTAWWGIDYMLLAKNDGKWMIRQILWEGPTPNASPTKIDKKGAKKAGLNYLAGFYEGDTMKLTNSLKTTIFKYGYSFNKKTGNYKQGKQMTFEKAIAFAENVKRGKWLPKANAPKEAEVLDIMNHTAAVKVTAYWGIDYLLLSRNGDKWMIEQVLWAGFPNTKK